MSDVKTAISGLQTPDAAIELPLHEHWSQTMDWLLQRVERMPRSVRFSLGDRMVNLGLDILASIIEARYNRSSRLSHLDRLNLNLEILRSLIRICHSRRYFSVAQYEFIARRMLEAGQMCGGWRRHMSHDR